MNNNTNKLRFFILAAFLFTGLLGSCIKEDNSDCPRPFKLFIKAVDADEKDITESGDVQQVILFVFEENGQIVDALTLNAEQIKSKKPLDIEPNYPGHKSLLFVAYGNTEGVEIPNKADVKKLNDLYVRLKQSGTKAQNKTAQSPSDLFFGNLSVPIEIGGIEPSGDKTIIIRRKTTQITITSLFLKQWNKNKEGSYSFILSESPDSYDKNGNLTGPKVDYKPAATMNTEGTLNAPIFRTFPTEKGKPYTVHILYDNKVIYTADKDDNGKPFIPEAGRMLNIIINFRAKLSIMAIITPWNEVYQYVEI